MIALVIAGMFLLSACKDSNPALVKEQKQTLTERQKALKEVTGFVDKDKAGEKAN